MIRVEEALEVANIRYDRLEGTMKRDERTRAMEALKHDPRCEVLLVSLKAGGVGLNVGVWLLSQPPAVSHDFVKLTAANHVFMVINYSNIVFYYC